MMQFGNKTTKEHMTVRAQILENKSKQCAVLLASDQISDEEKGRIAKKQENVLGRLHSLKSKLSLIESQKGSSAQSSDAPDDAAYRIQRAMRRFRFIKLKGRCEQIDNKLFCQNLSEHERALLAAKRMVVAERIKKLASQGKWNKDQALLEAKTKAISAKLLSPDIDDDQRARLSGRLHKTSTRIFAMNHGHDESEGHDRTGGGKGHHGMGDHGLGGKGHHGIGGKGHHGKGGKGHHGMGGKGHHGKGGKGHHGKGGKGHHGKGGKGHHGKGGKGHHGKGGKGHHGKGGKGHHGKGGKGHRHLQAEEMQDWEITDAPETYADAVPVALAPVEKDLDLEFATALSMDKDSDSDSDE